MGLSEESLLPLMPQAEKCQRHHAVAKGQKCPEWLVMWSDSVCELFTCFMCAESSSTLFNESLCTAKILTLVYKSCKGAACGWSGGGTERQRERDFNCSLQRNMKPQNIPAWRALDPEYSRWWHFIPRGWFYALQSRESVWSIDQRCCCPRSSWPKLLDNSV